MNLKLFPSKIDIHNKFIKTFIFLIILERICLERGFQKIKMKNRCNPCKMEKYAYKIMELVDST